ncbi:MAG: DUF6783 domain-containing protein [Blautia sp.]
MHSDNLHAPLCGIFAHNSVSVARYASFIGVKSPTNCDAQLAESNFQTHSRKKSKHRLRTGGDHMILLGIVILLIAAYLFYALVYPEKL